MATNKNFVIKHGLEVGGHEAFDSSGILSADTMGNITTDHLSEGSTNLFYTDTRVSTYLTTNSFATESYVDSAITNLVDSSPEALNTLNELAQALGDDPNFATTVNNAISTNTTEIENAKAEAVAFAIALG